jgi:hypothetical protein
MSARIHLFGDSHQPHLVSQDSDRRQAREAVAAYHEAKLAKLLSHVAEAIERASYRGLSAYPLPEHRAERLAEEQSPTVWVSVREPPNLLV